MHRGRGAGSTTFLQASFIYFSADSWISWAITAGHTIHFYDSFSASKPEWYDGRSASDGCGAPVVHLCLW